MTGPTNPGTLRVGRIGKPHGLRGEVTVTPSTDDPDTRFAVGSVLLADPPALGPLTVTGSRRSGGMLVVAFAGTTDRAGAEALRGTVLEVEADALPETGDEDDFYDYQLIGLSVRLPDGTVVGEVAGVMHPPAAPVLEVRRIGGSEELVPFVRAVVPEVDLAGGFLTVDPPEGMFS